MSHKWNETSTVMELRALAKERGLKGYSRLKKDALVRKLIAPLLDLPVFDPPAYTESVVGPPLLDTPFSDNSSVLLPTKATITVPPSTVKTKFNEWFDWLKKHIPPVRKVDEALKSFINKVESL